MFVMCMPVLSHQTMHQPGVPLQVSARAEQSAKKAGREAASSGKRAAREAQSAAQQAAPKRGGLFGRAKPAPAGAPSYSQPSVPPSASCRCRNAALLLLHAVHGVLLGRPLWQSKVRACRYAP